MAEEKAPTVWVPTCCGRIMRYNVFRQQGGGAYGTFVCTVCSKSINLEQEPLAALNSYGEGSSVLNILGSPRPPRDDRRKTRDSVIKAGSDEPTL